MPPPRVPLSSDLRGLSCEGGRREQVGLIYERDEKANVPPPPPPKTGMGITSHNGDSDGSFGGGGGGFGFG